MKCSINAHGLMTISPESPLEAYALGRWILDAGQVFDPLEPGINGRESFMWRGTKLIVSASDGSDEGER